MECDQKPLKGIFRTAKVVPHYKVHRLKKNTLFLTKMAPVSVLEICRERHKRLL